MDASKLGTNTTNKGTVEIATTALMNGNLAKNITGSGDVQINTNLGLLDAVEISNLDLNNGTLKLNTSSNISDYVVTNIKGSGNLQIDVDMTGTTKGTADKIAVDNAASGTSINLTSVNITANRNENFDGADYIDIISGAGKDNINYSIAGDTLKVLSQDENGVFVYEITTGDTKGSLNVVSHKTEAYLDNFINRVKLDGTDEDAAAFSLNVDTVINPETLPATGYTYEGTLGTTKGTGEELTVNMNHGVTLTGASDTGITVANNDTLNFIGHITNPATGDSTVKGFTNAFVNNGTLKVSNIEFEDNTTADIQNNNILKLSGANTLNKGITGTAGNTEIIGGKTVFNGDIIQNKIKITTGTLEGNANNLKSQTENNAALNITGGKISAIASLAAAAKDIYGTGTLNINGSTVVGNATDTAANQVKIAQNIINVGDEDHTTINLTNFGHIEGQLNNYGTVYNNSSNTFVVTGGTNEGNITEQTGYDGSGHLEVAANATYTNNGLINQGILTIDSGAELVNNTYISSLNKGIITIGTTLDIANDGKITNNGQFNLNGASMQNNGTIENNSVLNINSTTSFSNNKTISGTGTLNVGANAVLTSDSVNSQITQNKVNIGTSGELDVTADKITTTSGIENHGTLWIKGTTTDGATSIFNANNTVSDDTTGFSIVKIIGNVTNNADITQKVIISGIPATVTPPVAAIPADVINNGTIVSELFENYGEFENGINGSIEAKIVNNGIITSNADNIKGTMVNGISTDSQYNVTGSASPITVKGVSNAQDSEYIVTGGSIGYAVSGAGTTIIDGDVSIADTTLGSEDNIITSAIKVNANKSLTTKAGKIGAAVTNNGMIDLKEGILAYNIADENAVTNSEVKISGAVEANANITTDTLTVNGANAKLTIDANKTVKVDKTLANSTEIENNGILNITASTSNSGTISGTGTLNVGANAVLTSDSVNSQITQNKVNIGTSGELDVTADKITTTSGIENHGTLWIKGTTTDGATSIFNANNTVSDDTTGFSIVKIIGNVTNNADITQKVIISGIPATVTPPVAAIPADVINNGTIVSELFENYGEFENGINGSIEAKIVNNGIITSNADNIKGTMVNGISTDSQYNVTGSASPITVKGVSNAQDSEYIVTGGSIGYAVSGAGTTIIDGDVSIADTTLGSEDNIITSAIKVNANKSLTTKAGKIGAAVTNNGMIDLKEGILAYNIADENAVTNSEVKISGAVEANANITTDTLTVNGANAKLTIDANKTVKVDKTLANSTEIENNGILNITASTSNSGTISGTGTLDIDNDLSTTGNIKQNILDIASGKILTNASNDVEIANTLIMADETSKITNGGNLILSGANMNVSGTIDGNGILKVKTGTVTNNGSITQDRIEIEAKTTTPAANPKFVSNLGTKLNITTIDNQNKLELTGGTTTAIENKSIITGGVGETTFKGNVKNTKDIIQATVNNEGTMENIALINANVVNTGKFENSGNGEITGDVKTSNEFKTAADKVTGSIENSAILNLTGDTSTFTIANINSIDGIEGIYGTTNITNGKVDLTGLNNGNIKQKTITIAEGSELKAEISDVLLQSANKTITNDGNLIYIGGNSSVNNDNKIVQTAGKTNATVTLQKAITNNADITAKIITSDTNANIKNAASVKTTGTGANEGFINKAAFENTTGSVEGKVTNESTGNLTSAIDKIIGSVDNAGTLNLKGGLTTGELTMAITGITNDTGTTNVISGVVDNLVNIEQKTVNVANGTTLNNAANTIKIAGTGDNEGFVNAGTVNNGGTITGSKVTNSNSLTNSGRISTDILSNTKNINNTGTINADITNTGDNAKIKNTGNIYKVISNTGEIETIAAGLKDTAASDGILKLNAGTTKDKGDLSINITGSGDTYIEDKITVTAAGSITQGYIEVENGLDADNKIILRNDGGSITADNGLVNGKYAVLELENSGTTKITNLLVDEGTLKLIDGAKLTDDSNVRMINDANLELSAKTQDVNFYSMVQSPSFYSIIADSDNGWKVTIDSNIEEANSIKTTANSILDLGYSAIESLNSADDKYVEMGTDSTLSLNAHHKVADTAESIAFKSTILGDSYTLNINNEKNATKTLTLDTKINGAKEIDVKNGTLEIIDSTDIGNIPINLEYTVDNTTGDITSTNTIVDFDAADTINLTSDVKGIDAYDSLGNRLSDTTNHKVNINNQSIANPTAGLVKVTSTFDNVAVNAQAGELWLVNPNALKDSATLVVQPDATLNVINNTITEYGNNITFEDGAKLKFDVHMTNYVSDNFKKAAKNGTVVIDEFNPLNAEWIVHDSARIGLKEALGIENLAFSDKAKAQHHKVLTPIRELDGFFDAEQGVLNYYKTGDNYENFNSSIFNSSVAAQIGGYLTQLDTYNQALNNLDMYSLMTQEERQAAKFANKYAASDADLIFTPLSNPNLETSAWFRPYTTFENVKLKGGPKVSNVAYGTFAGLESGLYDMGYGWDANFGVYAGYNGSHQAYHGNSIYQNGATLGLVGMAFKKDFFIGTTINVSDNLADASNMYGKDDFNMLMSGAALKGGYNWQLAEGKFVIQPSFQTSYSFVNTFDYTNAAGVRVHNDSLHAIQLEPQIKFIGNLKNGWQPYAHLSGVWNILDKADVRANDVTLPEISVKPYARYGFGIRKIFGDRMSGFFQTFFTSGGRNGMGLQFGFRIQVGETKKKPRINSEYQQSTSNSNKKYISKKA